MKVTENNCPYCDSTNIRKREKKISVDEDQIEAFCKDCLTKYILHYDVEFVGISFPEGDFHPVRKIWPKKK